MDLQPPATTSLEDLTQLVKDHKPAKLMFDQFVQHFENLVATNKIKQFVVAQEICGATWATSSDVRVHTHAWIKKGPGMTVQLEDLCWQESAPYVNQSALEFFGGKGSRSATASYSGAFYLQVRKVGAVRQHGTVTPFSGYHVKDYWITTMLTSGKITFDTARQLYVQCVVRAENNIRQLDYVQRLTLDMQAARDKEACDAEILKSEVAFKTIEAVETWKQQYSTVKSRYAFLVLDGPSQTGKTRFAYSLSPPPTKEVLAKASEGLSTHCSSRKCVYYADCSGGLPDLRNFRREQHRVLVLDELHPTSAVLLKKIMQASNDVAILGASPTMQHAYRVNSYQTMIIVTTNTWAPGCATMQADDVEWLKANSVYVHVTSPLWKQ